MCTKIQDFACKIPKFFRGLYPRTPSAGGATPSRTHPSMAAPCAAALCAPAPRTQTPTHTSTPPKFKILYNTLFPNVLDLKSHKLNCASRLLLHNTRV
jgi:hypothetical protein